MKKLLTFYNFVIVSVLVFIGFLSAASYSQILSASIFYPIFVYFALLLVPKPQKAVVLPKEVTPTKSIKHKSKKNLTKTKRSKEKVVELKRIEEDGPAKKFDIDRRAFIKLVGSGGMAVFLFSVFGIKKAQAAFFGSVPGPGIVGLKDASGTRIDPAEKHPTDGYKITEIDDASSPAYYGFVNKDGAWFIMRENSSGEYRYTSGSSDFTNATTGWPNRASLSYGYFDTEF
jgi:hypothetical protein